MTKPPTDPALTAALPEGRTHFRLGVNYWPHGRALTWWDDFDADQVARDLDRIADARIDSIRIFLTWESFQPGPEDIREEAVEHLRTVLDLADARDMSVIPVLFSGCMRGLRALPGWALGDGPADDSANGAVVVSGGKVVDRPIRNWYEDGELRDAQAKLAMALSKSLAGHDALWAWDLGHQASACCRPKDEHSADRWLEQMNAAIRAEDEDARITMGMQVVDLEEDRGLGPRQLARVGQLLGMHACPTAGALWRQNLRQDWVLPFVADITRWLGGDKPMLCVALNVPGSGAAELEGRACVELERLAAERIDGLIETVRGSGCVGAMLWCAHDPGPEFPAEVKSRTRPLWNADGSPTLAANVIASHAEQPCVTSRGASRGDWLDISRDDFRRTPKAHMKRLFPRWRAVHA